MVLRGVRPGCGGRRSWTRCGGLPVVLPAGPAPLKSGQRAPRVTDEIAASGNSEIRSESAVTVRVAHAGSGVAPRHKWANGRAYCVESAQINGPFLRAVRSWCVGQVEPSCLARLRRRYRGRASLCSQCRVAGLGDPRAIAGPEVFNCAVRRNEPCSPGWFGGSPAWGDVAPV